MKQELVISFSELLKTGLICHLSSELMIGSSAPQKPEIFKYQLKDLLMDGQLGVTGKYLI
jgi:hypothetical protein